jgi:hypothetical protein
VVASLGVAKQSLEQVAMLHALAYDAGRHGGIPAAEIPGSARTLARAFDSDIRMATMLRPPAGSSADRFVATLRTYAASATTLSRWSPASGSSLGSEFWSTIRATDQTWLGLLGEIGHASSQNLTATMAPLLYDK